MQCKQEMCTYWTGYGLVCTCALLDIELYEWLRVSDESECEDDEDES